MLSVSPFHNTAAKTSEFVRYSKLSNHQREMFESQANAFWEKFLKHKYSKIWAITLPNVGIT